MGRFTVRGVTQTWNGSAWVDTTLDLSKVADIHVTRGGGDDYANANVSACTLKWKTTTARWALGTRLQLWITDTSPSPDVDFFTFDGHLTEARWNDTDGVTEAMFRGHEYLFLRASEGLAANTNVGARASINALLDSFYGGPWTGNWGTDRFLPSSFFALNRPAQSTTLNGAYIVSLLAGNPQNLIWRQGTTAVTSQMNPSPDYIYLGDYGLNSATIDAEYLYQLSVDADKMSFQDCGVATGQVVRRFTVTNDTLSISQSTVCTGIDTEYLEQVTRVTNTYARTASDATSLSSIEAVKQGGELRTHRLYRVVVWPDKYDELGGTNADYLWMLQPGDSIDFTSLPTAAATNWQTWSHYDADYDGTNATTRTKWDVRSTSNYWTPDGGWRFELGLTPRAKDGTSGAASW